VIVLDQVPKLLGTHIAKHGFFADLLSVAQHLPETSLLTLAVALATLAILVAMERLWPHSPAPLAAVGAGIAAAWWLGLEALGVSTVGRIPQGLASITMPGLALAVSCCRRPRNRADELHRNDRGRSSVRASRRSRRSMPIASWSPSVRAISPVRFPAPCRRAAERRRPRSSAPPEAARSGLRSSPAGAALATMLFLAPLLGLLPNATLAMIVIVYSVGLIQPGEFVAIRKVRTMEFRWAIVAALGVLLFGTLQGIVVAIIASLISLSTQATRRSVHVIGRKRGADVLRPISARARRRRDVRGPADPATRGSACSSPTCRTSPIRSRR
jgi:MFS superfamily sulfate permease-like transporter